MSKASKSFSNQFKKSKTLNSVSHFLKKSAKRGFAFIVGGFLGLLISMAFASFANLSGVKAQSSQPSNAVFVQPSVSFPNGNPDLYIDTGSEVTTLSGKLKVNPSATAIPNGLSDRQVVSDYSGAFVGSLGAFVQSFVDVWDANLGVRDKFWVDHQDDGTFLSPTNGTKAVSLSKIGVPIFPIAPTSTIDTHPTLTHQFVAHGQVGQEKKICADALGYIQLCDEPVPTTHEGAILVGMEAIHQMVRGMDLRPLWHTKHFVLLV